MLDAEAVQLRVGTGRLNSKNKNRKVCNTHLLLKVKSGCRSPKKAFRPIISSTKVALIVSLQITAICSS